MLFKDTVGKQDLQKKILMSASLELPFISYSYQSPVL